MAQREISLTADLASQPFAGRIGGNQEFILDPKNLDHVSTLKRVPDASPFIPLRGAFKLRGFLERELWRAAVIEGIGTLLLVWSTGLIAAQSSAAPSPVISPTSGFYSTPVFLGSLTGGITNMIILTLFIYSLGPVSGAHLNPMITMSTFAARSTSLPRMVLYIAFQMTGGILGGLLLRVSFGSRNFVVAGCSIDGALVPAGGHFVLEFMADFMLLFFAFGVGLDPRQRETYGPALAPFLVGVALGVISFGTGFARAGYGGASLNPARCTGVFVGSHFPNWAWVIWLAPATASLVHGVVYWAFPPWAYPKPDKREISSG